MPDPGVVMHGAGAWAQSPANPVRVVLCRDMNAAVIK
jgi:hypothetical protein